MNKNVPNIFEFLLSDGCIESSDIIKTTDGFFMVYKSLSNLLGAKGIVDFCDSSGERLECNRFFDDWFLYAVANENDYTHSLLKMREQEYDAQEGTPADSDIPGVTVSFIEFKTEILLDCLTNPDEENKSKLNNEINRVVCTRGQSHHKALKKYFKNPRSDGSYLIAETFVKHIASYEKNGYISVPERFKELLQQSISYKNSAKLKRLPFFIQSLNQVAQRTVCDNEKIYIEDSKNLNEYEALAILATHTGNISFYSFAAEVEYHARFLTVFSKIKIPFFGRSIYDSAIRADMTVCDTEFEGPAPFYKTDSKITKRQYVLHSDKVSF